MGYRENVQIACDELGIKYPILESDIDVQSISFLVGDDWITIERAPTNRDERLFFQLCYEPYREQHISNRVWISGQLRLFGTIFFAENWIDAEEKGRAMLIAFKQATYYSITWK